jgi:hypothetical protein
MRQGSNVLSGTATDPHPKKIIHYCFRDAIEKVKYQFWPLDKKLRIVSQAKLILRLFFFDLYDILLQIIISELFSLDS